MKMMKLFNRQKVVLNSINELENKGINSRRAIVKSQFLLKEEYSVGNYIKFYSFYPYKQGPFSQLCYDDLRKLKTEGLIDKDETSLTENGKEVLRKLDKPFTDQIQNLMGRFENENQMTGYVYSHFPEFTVKSELIERKKINDKKKGFFTIGYESKDIDYFLNILIRNDINLVVDVRKNAFSMNFMFIKEKLKKYLESVGISYIHIPELGIENKFRKELKGRDDYENLFNQYCKELNKKIEHLNHIIDLGQSNRLALLCFENDVDFCHRREIAKFIRKNNFKVVDL